MSSRIWRSSSYNNLISMDNKMVSLTDKDGNIYSPFYINLFGRIYYMDEDDNIIFIKDDSLSKYIIKEIN